MSQKLTNVALFVISGVSVAASYAGLDASIAIDNLWWKLLSALIAGATGVAIFTFWKGAFDAATKPDQFRFRSAGWIATFAGILFLIGMSSWWNVAGIGGPEANRAAIYDTSRQAELGLAKTVHQSTAYRGFLFRLESLAGEISNLASCESRTGCITGSPGKQGVYQTLVQMKSKMNNIIASIKSADSKLDARAQDGQKCLAEMRSALSNESLVKESANAVSKSIDCINSTMADIAGLDQLGRIAQELTSFTSGLVLPVSIRSDAQRQAVANIFKGIAKRAGFIAANAREEMKPAKFKAISLPRMSAMKAVVVYYDSVLPFWITGVGLDLLPLVLLSFASTLTASNRSRPDAPARNWTIHDYLQVRDLENLIEAERFATGAANAPSSPQQGDSETLLQRIGYKEDESDVPDFWYEDIEFVPYDEDDDGGKT